MDIKGIDINKDRVTLGDHIENMKEKASNLFDGDDSNSNNVFDLISHQIDSVLKECNVPDKKTTE